MDTLIRFSRSHAVPIGIAIFFLFPSGHAAQASLGQKTAKAPTTLDGKPYSPAVANKEIPNRLLWGDTHLHTSNSLDAGFSGTRVGPEDAFRFARGEEVVSSSGVPAKLSRPYDFLVVIDHSDYMGLPMALEESAPELLADPEVKRWYDGYRKGGEATYPFSRIWTDILGGVRQPKLNIPGLERSSWELAVKAAEKYNEPGRFTAFAGFEWTSSPGGDHMHRNVIFRDGSDKTLKVLPFTVYESGDPEKLWQYLAEYEAKTGGQALAVPHNSNLSAGLMFADTTFGGKPFDRAYAEQRAKWEPVVEVTQTKGDSETNAPLSPDDEFADFERWDSANIKGNDLHTAQQEPFNYIRPTLTRGLKHEQILGTNPFKFGLVGGTDIHTGLSTAVADNFFGVFAMNARSEPGPGRLRDKAPLQIWRFASSGLAAVWAKENTRAAIFDALRRKEVYASTGPRIFIRLFAGWEFKPRDVDRSDFVNNGYAHGVPMGGDLTGAPGGRSPTLLIQAAKDPDGANLDRVQVIKGWLDEEGQTHEKVFDAAWSGPRKLDQNGRLPPVGITVDSSTATYSNSIGAPCLNTEWTDPQFDPKQRSYYYIRVLEIPTPRWSTYDSVRFGVKIPTGCPASVTQRAYTSPIWYTPLDVQ